MKYLYLSLILLISASLAGCGQIAVGIEEKTPAPTSIFPEPTTVVAEVPTIIVPTPNKTFEIPIVTPTESLNPTLNASKHWTVQQDPYGFFRFAAPCFWRIGGLPDGQPQPSDLAKLGIVTYGLYNFPEDYASAFPRGQGALESGGFKVAIELHYATPGISLKKFIENSVQNSQAEILLIEETTVNSLPAVTAQIRDTEFDSIWRFYLIQLNETTFLRFFAEPSGKLLDTSDVQSLLNSITVDPAANITLPTHIPAAPPTGVTAACMP